MATKPLVITEEIVHGSSGPERPVMDSGGLEHCLPPGTGLATSLALDQSPKAQWHILPVNSL